MRFPRIVVTPDPEKPATPWRVNVPPSVAVDGVRFRRWFATEPQARRFAAEQERASRNHTDRAFSLTEAHKEEAARAFALVVPFGRSLLDAVTESVARWEQEGASVDLASLREAVLAAKRQDGRTQKRLTALGTILARFSAAFPERQVSTILPAEIDGWLRGLGVGPVSRDTYRETLHAAFSHAVRRGWCQGNPVARVERAGGIGREAVILSPEQVASLLSAADPRLVPWLALGAFAGLRPWEALRATWADIGADFIVLSAAKTKTRARRRIPILPALAAWLATADRSRPLSPGYMTTRRLRLLAQEASGLGKWPQDCLRKSWISYRLAITNDENETAQIAGNSPKIIVTNYRSLTDATTAERWFALRPAGSIPDAPSTQY